ncbi:hypothetical protein HIM_06083 [Hirsutella minnesotensis 3608]|uniref:DUF1996 domain-containing protein n=1 Tax=Hirsutella minnesotensis 3608 TaxID=1043627 RepID=A0A0F7ZZM6_9HYPO|nr:hypothetical protein HIM_06083 [Hirsutella minnesotensis 3608]
MVRSLFALSAGLIAGAHAFWRMECPGRLAMARMDPIVNPGDLSPHVHSIHGSSGFSDNSSCSDLQAGECTSCRVKQDMSSYWHPSLYFKDADTGRFEVVEQVGGMLAYYLLYGQNIKAFPDGFRMLSGDVDRREYTLGDANKPDPPKASWASLGQTTQKALAQRAIGFNCLNYGRTPEATLYRHFLPDKSFLDSNCKDGLRFEIMFPSCWNGRDVDSQNHMDHVAFPDLVMDGTCPPDYPVRLPSLLYEVIWNTAAFSGRNGRFVLSNGDETGYSYHGDFMMGWNRDFLQQAVNTCTNPSGRIEDCPLFDIMGKGEAVSCNLQSPMPPALHTEDVEGPMMRLPGGGGSGGGDKPSYVAPPAPPAPTLQYTPGEKAPDPAHPLPGQVFKEKSLAAALPAITDLVPEAKIEAAPPVPTVPPAPVSIPDTKSYYSTQWVTNGNVVSKIVFEAKTVTATEYVDVTTTVAAEPTYNPVLRRRRVAHLHSHGHRRNKL